MKPNRIIDNRHNRPLLYLALLCGVLFASWAVPLAAQARTEVRSVVIQTADARLVLRAGDHAPALVSLSRLDLSGHDSSVWRNAGDEMLPDHIDIQGVATPVQWTLASCKSDVHQVEFVYESAKPHLRLSWQWVARADAGPMEHRIAIENLSGQEIWLPLIDSLRLDWRLVRGVGLHNFYVEKGADAPSAHGAHLEHVIEGYRWIGRSSTYAHPVEGEAREIIPVEFVYATSPMQVGWYAGIEFSGRTRIALERKGDRLASRLGLNDEIETFRTRLEPGGSFETPTVFFWGHSKMAWMARAISFALGCELC